MIQKILIFWLILWSSLNPIKCFCQNIALNKPYTISALPNYKYGAPTTDKTSLTDGKYAGKGRFWTQKKTLGWRKKNKLEILINLQKEQAVEKIIFSTAAGTAGVYFPKNIYIFLSNDGKNFEYVGDIMNKYPAINSSYGVYKVEKLESEAIHKTAHFVKLVAVPEGNYLFTDEIEVLRSNKVIANKNNSNKNPQANDLDEFLNHQKLTEYEMNYLSSAVKKMPTQVKKGLNIQWNNKNPNIDQIESEIGKKFGAYLNLEFKKSWGIEQVNQWDALEKFHKPTSLKDQIDYDYVLPINNVQYGAFVITNSSAQEQKILIDFVGTNKIRHSRIDVFEVPFVHVTDGEIVPDPLVPIKSSLFLKEGQSKMILFKLEGKTKGEETHVIHFRNQDVNAKIKISLNIIQIPSLKGNEILNANVWSYFHYPILKNNKKIVSEDLHKHLINTIVVHTSALPLMNSSDFSKLKLYLNGVNKFDKILIFPNFTYEDRKNGYIGGKFMSEDWKKRFTRWYSDLLNAMKEIGYENKNIYFYPYDEVSGDENIRDYVKFARWAKQNVKGIQLYATITNPKALNALIPFMDIIQLHHSDGLTKSLPKHSSEIWTYSGSSPMRTLSPYSYFRLMAWQAFLEDYKGIGFWNYSSSEPTYPFDKPMLNTSTDYSVIYTGSNNVLYSTRRWEAFRLGLEDYNLLKLYSKQFGELSAKKLAKQVLSNPNNLDLADSIRNQILMKIL